MNSLCQEFVQFSNWVHGWRWLWRCRRSWRRRRRRSTSEATEEGSSHLLLLAHNLQCTSLACRQCLRHAPSQNRQTQSIAGSAGFGVVVFGTRCLPHTNRILAYSEHVGLTRVKAPAWVLVVRASRGSWPGRASDPSNYRSLSY